MKYFAFICRFPPEEFTPYTRTLLVGSKKNGAGAGGRGSSANLLRPAAPAPNYKGL
jgi:hypothetical protein